MLHPAGVGLNPLVRRLNRVQKNAVDRACHLLEEEGRCLIVMTTGTGKTIVGSKVMKEYPKDRVLWLTQTEELITQTYLELQRIFGAQEVGLFKRSSRSTSERIIVASLQTLEKDEYLEAIPRGHFQLLVVDEAHHSRAQTWEKVIRHFRAKKLGLTATPVRHDGRGLDELFGQAAFELSYEEAKKLRLIAEEVYRVILTNSKVQGIITRTGEYKPSELDRLVVSQNRNEIIVESYKKYGRGFMREHGLPRKAICFCITVDHAVRMRDLFLKHDIAADIIVSKHSHYATQEDRTNPLTEKERREVYQSFLDGTGPEVLCVVNVLNEGKNIPDVGCLLMARPTRSAIIYQQQIGRGCRRIEGTKEKFIVLDYVDLIHQKYPPMSLARVTGKRYAPEDIVLEYYRGKDPVVVDEYVEYLSRDYPFHPEPEVTRWTRASIQKALLRFYKKYRHLYPSDFNVRREKGPRLPTTTTIQKYWPTVRECVKELGLPWPEERPHWTKEEVERALHSWVERQGRILASDLTSKNGLPSIKMICKYWGNWRRCERALDLGDWPANRILAAIKQFKARHGRAPKKREFTSAYGLPSWRQVSKNFRTISQAIAAAS